MALIKLKFDDNKTVLLYAPFWNWIALLASCDQFNLNKELFELFEERETRANRLIVQ